MPQSARRHLRAHMHYDVVNNGAAFLLGSYPLDPCHDSRDLVFLEGLPEWCADRSAEYFIDVFSCPVVTCERSR
jgi:hypothetical protein